MAGRRLTQKQLAQVRRQQDKRVAAADEAEDAALGQPRDGLVVARFGKQADVEALDAPGMAVRCAIRANLESPVAGDRVVFRQGEAGAVIVAVLPRRTELRRPDNLGRIRTVAANIDDVLVVFAPLPSPSSDLLDRYLCACSIAGFRPRLLLNKADLAGPGDEATRIAALYESLGYPVLRCSAKQEHGLDALRAALAGRTSILVGQSGVGKSSLVNALLPDAQLATTEVSEVSGLGQHTTTTARLFHLPGGGALIDSPGVREFALWHVSEAELEDSYPEFTALRGRCRFRDCRHEREPGCALQAAVAAGTLSAERFRNFLRIRASLAEGGR
jgi:ribosome biogenesis GTPase